MIRRKGEKPGVIGVNTSIGDYMKQIQERTAAYENQEKEKVTTGRLTDTSAKAYYKEFKKVVEAADVLLQVLDARDPQGSRCLSMEETICNNGKKLVLVLNKADLVPTENLKGWLDALRREYPTVIFKASTQTQAKRLSHTNINKPMRNKEAFNTSACVGADVLMQLLKNYCRNKNIKTLISVGVVGLPNVGKSSLINSLKRSKACNVGAMPGITKNMQTITLDSKIKLIDCPGIITPVATASDSAFSLRNAIRVDTLDDPITPVEAILSRAGHAKMMEQYGLSDFKDTNEFLSLLAQKRGRILKQNIPDKHAAAVLVLNDWNGGKIKYFTQPPCLSEETESAQLITAFSEEFNIDDISVAEEQTFNSLQNCMTELCIDSVGSLPEMDDIPETYQSAKRECLSAQLGVENKKSMAKEKTAKGKHNRNKGKK